ncbi:uncharacterized protein LOC135495059 [Lineus longissimus]|uniref:uncharacterized protein LOC135495059 n=1 Tax=Lineus longissimus TaxID=88925 RepID=UPI00315DCAC2
MCNLLCILSDDAIKVIKMVRNYKPKTDRATYDGALVIRALEELDKGKSLIRFRQKARENENETKELNFQPRDLYRTRQVFTREEEAHLERYILKCSKLFHGLGYIAVRRLAYEYATCLGRNVPESWNREEKAGREWMSGFTSRHENLSLRSPEATSIARAHGFNKKAVGEFFALLSEAFAKHKFAANMVYNLDESGITTVQSVPKIIAEKGTKQVGQITAQERGTLVTVCCCVNAVGQALPPAMIFPRVNYKEYMVEGAPASTLGLATPTRWMNSKLFPQVLRHSIKHMGCSKEKPALLLVDNHDSHCSLEVVDLARENCLTIVTFPPHCSHKLQPLDISVYGPLKKYYSAAANEWNLSHPGRRITIYDLPMPACFARSFYKAFTYDNIVEGFK